MRANFSTSPWASPRPRLDDGNLAGSTLPVALFLRVFFLLPCSAPVDARALEHGGVRHRALARLAGVCPIHRPAARRIFGRLESGAAPRMNHNHGVERRRGTSNAACGARPSTPVQPRHKPADMHFAMSRSAHNCFFFDGSLGFDGDTSMGKRVRSAYPGTDSIALPQSAVRGGAFRRPGDRLVRVLDVMGSRNRCENVSHPENVFACSGNARCTGQFT